MTFVGYFQDWWTDTMVNVHTWIERCRCRDRHAMVQNNQKSRLKYSATRSSIRLFACTIHSFTCSTLLASLMRSAVLTYWLTCSPGHSHTRGIVNDMMNALSVSFSVLDHSGTGMNGQTTWQVSLFLRKRLPIYCPTAILPSPKVVILGGTIRFWTRLSNWFDLILNQAWFFILICLGSKLLTVVLFLLIF